MRFIVCAVKISGETITNEWNTTVATAEVLEGLEVDTPSPTEQESDVIAQLLQIMKDTSDQAVEAVEAAEKAGIESLQEFVDRASNITFAISAEDGGLDVTYKYDDTEAE